MASGISVGLRRDRQHRQRWREPGRHHGPRSRAHARQTRHYGKMEARLFQVFFSSLWKSLANLEGPLLRQGLNSFNFQLKCHDAMHWKYTFSFFLAWRRVFINRLNQNPAESSAKIYGACVLYSISCFSLMFDDEFSPQRLRDIRSLRSCRPA